jgi:hypothetical protein
LIIAMMADVEEVTVVVAHNERATLRVGDVFLKIDSVQTRTDVEVEAMALGSNALRLRPLAGCVQRRRVNSRCQRNSVDGVTRKIGQRSRGSSFARVARIMRSAGV